MCRGPVSRALFIVHSGCDRAFTLARLPPVLGYPILFGHVADGVVPPFLFFLSPQIADRGTRSVVCVYLMLMPPDPGGLRPVCLASVRTSYVLSFSACTIFDRDSQTTIIIGDLLMRRVRRSFAGRGALQGRQSAWIFKLFVFQLAQGCA